MPPRTGGNLQFPEVNVEFELRRGDIIFFESDILKHGLDSFHNEEGGERSSIVFVNHNAVVNELRHCCCRRRCCNQRERQMIPFSYRRRQKKETNLAAAAVAVSEVVSKLESLGNQLSCPYVEIKKKVGYSSSLAFILSSTLPQEDKTQKLKRCQTGTSLSFKQHNGDC